MLFIDRSRFDTVIDVKYGIQYEFFEVFIYFIVFDFTVHILFAIASRVFAVEQL